MSGLVVDTHIAVWSMLQAQRLTPTERELLIDEEVQRFVSPMSVWEAAIKRRAGRWGLPMNLAAAFATEFDLLPIDAALLEAAAELPMHHRDPFDRVIIAHALRDEMPVLTRDPVFSKYGVTIAA